MQICRHLPPFFQHCCHPECFTCSARKLKNSRKEFLSRRKLPPLPSNASPSCSSICLPALASTSRTVMSRLVSIEQNPIHGPLGVGRAVRIQSLFPRPECGNAEVRGKKWLTCAISKLWRVVCRLARWGKHSTRRKKFHQVRLPSALPCAARSASLWCCSCSSFPASLRLYTAPANVQAHSMVILEGRRFSGISFFQSP